jgi:hypothetical protein
MAYFSLSVANYIGERLQMPGWKRLSSSVISP